MGPPKISPTEAVLLHNRYTNQSRKNGTKVVLLPLKTNIDNVRKAMQAQTRTVFPNGADFQFETQQRLGMCLQRWRETQNFCKTPIVGCQDVVLPLEDWYFTEAAGEFLLL
ncbi:hypothetical protein OSTOST_21064 [Ostertagia ostertagi]